MTCDDLRALAKSEHNTTAAERIAAVNHVRGCPACEAFMREEVKKEEDAMIAEFGANLGAAMIRARLALADLSIDRDRRAQQIDEELR